MPEAKLIISQPGKRTREVLTSDDASYVSVGRAQDNSICLQGDTNASKYHALFEKRADGIWLTDLGSTNGTTVNGVPLSAERKLSDGDLVCFGGASTVGFYTLKDEPKAGPAGSVAENPSAEPEGGVAPPVPSVGPQQPPAARPPGGPSLKLISLGVAAGLLIPVATLALIITFSPNRTGGPDLNASADTPGNMNAEDGPEEAESGEHVDARSDVGDSDISTPDGDAAIQPPGEEPIEAPPGRAAPAKEDVPAGPDEVEISEMVGALAKQLSGRVPQPLDGQFVREIRSRTKDYSGGGHFARAQEYRDVINEAFVNEQGLEPLLGFVTAMSRSRFENKDGGGEGLWRLPPHLVEAQGYKARCSPSATISDPDQNCSARVAAAYMKQLLGVFQGDHLNAVACFGMTTGEAGRWSTQFPEGRSDFWELIQSGIAGPDQRERVVRFFAAGVVAENPARFGLRDRPLKDLYPK